MAKDLLGVEMDIDERWENGIEHHFRSKEVLERLREIDSMNNDIFDWKCGGDGDNGEELMFELDILFEQEDVLRSRGETRCSLCGEIVQKGPGEEP